MSGVGPISSATAVEIKSSEMAGSSGASTVAKAKGASELISKENLREINARLAKAGMSMNTDLSVSLHPSRDVRKISNH